VTDPVRDSDVFIATLIADEPRDCQCRTSNVLPASRDYSAAQDAVGAAATMAFLITGDAGSYACHVFVARAAISTSWRQDAEGNGA